MATSRESYNLFQDIKNKNWPKVIKSLKLLIPFNPFHLNLWDKSYIIKDTFITPFHRSKIGCNLLGHDYITPNELSKYDTDGMHFCKKCYKFITQEEYKQLIRNNKLKKLL